MRTEGQCPHTTFRADVQVANFDDNTLKYADVKIICTDCGKPAVFTGMPIGVLPDKPTMGFGGQEARLPFIVEGDAPATPSAGFIVNVGDPL